VRADVSSWRANVAFVKAEGREWMGKAVVDIVVRVERMGSQRLVACSVILVSIFSRTVVSGSRFRRGQVDIDAYASDERVV